MPGVFLIDAGSETLVKMSQAEYLDEDDLQALIAKQPALLQGCTSTNEDAEGSLLLIKREMGVPDSASGSARWSMDHFYIDQSGVPVFVEVKRSKNGDVRRAVIGQLLDYAANGQSYWTIAAIKEAFDRQWGSLAQEQLERFLEEASIDSPVTFWQNVEANLRRSNIRLVFVADQLPPELKRVIEFLNEQMVDVEVLGVELRQFRSDGSTQRVIAPTIVGRTSQADITKGRVNATQDFGELDAVVIQFRELSKGQPPVSAMTGPYRKIRLSKRADSRAHYEFLILKRRGLGIHCDFHVEGATNQPNLEAAMRAFDGTPIEDKKIEYFDRGQSGALRLAPIGDVEKPADVARVMLSFISATKEILEEAAVKDGFLA